MAHPPEAAATADLPRVEASPAAGGPSLVPTNSNARLESNPPRASRESIDSTEAAAAGANAPAPAAIRARPAPNKKSYLPTYAAPEAYGKKANNRLAEVRKEAEEKVAKQMAKKERERKLSRQKAKKNLIAVEETTEDDVEAWQLFFTIALGIFLAFAEALDFDVLLGIIFMPIIKVMEWLAHALDNEQLNPSYWSTKIVEWYNHLCHDNPAGFVGTDLGLWTILFVLILFEADLAKWWRERKLREQGYDNVDEKEEEEDDDGAGDEVYAKLFHERDTDGSGFLEHSEMDSIFIQMFGEGVDTKILDEIMESTDTNHDGVVDKHEFIYIMKHCKKRLGGNSSMLDTDKMTVALRHAREDLEEVNLLGQLRGDAIEPKAAEELSARRAKLEETIGTLSSFLSAMETAQAEAVDLEAAAKEAEEAERARKKQGSCGEMTKVAVAVLKNTISGVLTIYLYFMDLISDFQVTMLYFDAGALLYGSVSASMLVAQFVVVWLRVLPYLQVTYGSESTFYRLFLYFGMPLGCFFFDALMFLGPFGLLPIVPMPEAMRLFVPAYGATRMIAEVLVEAFPQFIMQAIIFVLVSEHVRDGTASAHELALYTVQDGNFVSLMPKSILISSLGMLKTWYDLVQEAREAGVSVAQKGVQLWNVGAGLPLDAIKNGSITSWGCAYEISDQEVVSLVDAVSNGPPRATRPGHARRHSHLTSSLLT